MTDWVRNRDDPAEEALPHVDVPTLFIVGSDDDAVLERNRDAYDELDCTNDLEIIERAGHLFKGPGELEEEADVAPNWFETRLQR